jgi:putative hydrolase of the HAD superfamily
MAAPLPPPPARIDAVLLDAGGVLLDLDYAYLGRLIEARHRSVPSAELARAEALARSEVNRTVQAGGRVSHAWRDYFRILLRHVAVPVAVHEAIVDALWSAHQQVGLWTAAADGARQALAELQELGFRMGVVSNAEGQVARDLDRAGFSGMFETVVDSHLVGVEKPDPAIFAIALERMGLDPGSTMFLGDLPSVDVAGARAAGLAPVLLDRHDLYREIDAPRLRSILELPRWLARAQGN